ncbi:type VI lipase adapter Tla3 domain-containing protein [Pseudomonas prosekii]|uniref:DUF2875 domain-containing protein n=1 Tax=Pseudomonas prosekii TaxID=1148509 RepID=A0A1H1YBU2_9PSED|nr:Protein of unknown function [Pseudomonas prosekii]
MRLEFACLFFTGLLLTSPLVQAAEHPSTVSRCFASAASPVNAYTSAKEAATMPVDARYRAPATSPHLDTLDVLAIGLSLDVFRQGQAWKALQEQNAKQTEALHVGSILPTDPKKYPVDGDDKDLAYDKRKADALELGLRDFMEKWPIPTITVVRGWNPDTPNLRYSPERTREMLSGMVNSYRTEAGLHWHRVRNLQDGVVCSDTPEGLVENLFNLFEQNPDLPAVLVYNVEGFSMSFALSAKKAPLIGGPGPRKPGELTDAMVAMVVGRPERVEWLRYYAQFAKVNENKIDPEFTGWGARKPAVEFLPSTFIPQPWTQRAFEQWDAQPVLAKLHRPVTVSLLRPDNGERLKRDALTVKLAAGWKEATDGLAQKPVRVFFDGGSNTTPLAELLPALTAAHSPLDLLDSRESYDLTQRLGDTGSASPFVGLTLATMASYLNADTSVVMPMRRPEQATIIAVTSPTPGKKPSGNDHFGVNLMPQTASTEEPPAVPSSPSALKMPDIEQDHTLEEFLADQKPKSNWMDDL